MADTAKQKRFFGAVLSRIRAGKRRRGDPEVTEAQAAEIASAPVKKRKKSLMSR